MGHQNQIGSREKNRLGYKASRFLGTLLQELVAPLSLDLLFILHVDASSPSLGCALRQIKGDKL